MHKEILTQYQRLLNQLKEEIAAYPDEKSVWKTTDGISNSGGTLCYHLCGNLNHFIGKGMGKTGYSRNRPLEFSIRDVPKKDLINWVEETSDMLGKVIPTVDLTAEYPREYWGEIMTVSHSLLKLLWHLGYHLGQVNYHRRLLVGE